MQNYRVNFIQLGFNKKPKSVKLKCFLGLDPAINQVEISLKIGSKGLPLRLFNVPFSRRNPRHYPVFLESKQEEVNKKI
jgi:hypothetical protein